MSDIITLFSEYKSDIEKQEFIEKQHKTITSLINKNKKLEEEVEHLKKLLETSTSLIELPKVEQIIITPEEGLLDRQLQMIQDRGFSSELTLEDVKKIDILLKNKKIIKEKYEESIETSSKRFDKKLISNAELIKLATSANNNDD